MAKIGRNASCPCGSGKKYKKCHGREQTALSVPGAPPIRIPAQGATQNLPAEGLPGLPQYLTVVFEYRDPQDPRNRPGPQGQPGEYEVVFTFSRPGFSLQPEYNASFADGLKGTSHLAICGPSHTSIDATADRIRLDAVVDSEQLAFTGYPDASGFLSRLVGRCHARDFLNAHRKAFRAVAPALSNWSLQLDIPIFVYQVDLTEIASGAKRMTFNPPFQTSPLVLRPNAELKPDFRGYAGLYREALNSNSQVYQYLCFFKIIESVRKRRKRLGGEARARGEAFSRPPEVLPASAQDLTPWLNALFTIRPPVWDKMVIESVLLPEVAGKKFGTIIERELIPLRTSIAHALFESAELNLSVDVYETHEKINRLLPVTKCMVRRMLKNEFPRDFLSHLPDP
jgi:Methylamine utilization protein MauJ/SEC-C motif